MKKFLLFMIVASLSLSVEAQNPPSETKVKFGDKEQRAASYEVPYASDLVEQAIADRMAGKGSRPEKVRGYTLYRGVNVKEFGPRADLYFKVERKGRKDKNSSLITVFALTPNENASTANSDDDQLQASKDALDELMPAIEAKNLESDLARHQAGIREAEKKLKRLEDDYADYDKKMKSLQERMADNKRNQEAETAEIEKLRSFLEALKQKSGS